MSPALARPGMHRPALIRLVLLISCAHALVHAFELSLPSVEMLIAREYFSPDAPAAQRPLGRQGGAETDSAGSIETRGKSTMGRLSATWRLPFGLGALLAGWLVDRWGPRRLLLVYLVGCSVASGLAWWVRPLPGLFAVMFLMGACASIYHPAGLTWLSWASGEQERARVLGMHGIFGSAGIAAAPFLVGAALSWGVGWRTVYAALTIPGIALAMLVFGLPEASHPADRSTDTPDGRIAWGPFALLTTVALLQGMVYAGVMAFLPRYLTAAAWSSARAVGTGVAADRLASANQIAAGVLLVGCVGQYLAGRLARPEIIERQLTWVVLANAPMLLWMAWATGSGRILAAGLFSIVHFMYQPIYNSLVARYTPIARRSLCYGLSFALSFGVGGSGAMLVADLRSERAAYALLAAVALLSTAVASVLWWSRRPRSTPIEGTP